MSDAASLTQLLLISGAIGQLTAEEQATIHATADTLRAAVTAAGESGVVALGLVMAEIAADAKPKVRLVTP